MQLFPVFEILRRFNARKWLRLHMQMMSRPLVFPHQPKNLCEASQNSIALSVLWRKFNLVKLPPRKVLLSDIRA